MGKQNKAKRLTRTYLNSGPWDPLLSRDLMIRADTGWVPQEVVWGVLAVQNSSAVVGPRGFVSKLYLDCSSHKIEHKSIVRVSGVLLLQVWEGDQVSLFHPLVPPVLSSFTVVLKSQRARELRASDYLWQRLIDV